MDIVKNPTSAITVRNGKVVEFFQWNGLVGQTSKTLTLLWLDRNEEIIGFTRDTYGVAKETSVNDLEETLRLHSQNDSRLWEKLTNLFQMVNPTEAEIKKLFPDFQVVFE